MLEQATLTDALMQMNYSVPKKVLPSESSWHSAGGSPKFSYQSNQHLKKRTPSLLHPFVDVKMNLQSTGTYSIVTATPPLLNKKNFFFPSDSAHHMCRET